MSTSVELSTTYSLRAGVSQLVADTDRASQTPVEASYSAEEAEVSSLQLGRSMYVVQDVAADEDYTAKNFLVMAHRLGLYLGYLYQVLGRRAVCDIEEGGQLRCSRF